MHFLKRFNPAKSLFLKVFLWFWLATFLMVISSLWLANQLDSEVKYRPLNTKQQKELSSMTRRVQKQLNKFDASDSLQSLLSQTSRRYRFGLVLLDPENQKAIYGTPRRYRSDVNIFKDFDSQHSSRSLAIWADGLIYWGTSNVTVGEKAYLLFMVMHRPGGDLQVVRHQYPGLFVGLFILLSGGLCYLFVHSLLKPVVQLQNASKRMAKGDLAVRVVSVSNRLDEIGQLGRDFNYMSEQVEHLLIGQKRLLADISHELRSPLARLQLSIGIAQQQNESDVSEDILLALDRIEKEALQIEEMIKQVLMLSKLDNQQPIQNLQSVTLEQIMTPIIADAQFEAEQAGKRLNYKGEENITFDANPQLLSSAVENVLRNAIYYSVNQVEVRTAIVDQSLSWIISDDGTGIPEEQLSRIFEAFYRESTARDRDSGGVGLGLAIAYQAINKHQGNITAANLPTGGLSVTITIPIKAN